MIPLRSKGRFRQKICPCLTYISETKPCNVRLDYRLKDSPLPHSSIIGDVDFIIVGAGSAGCVLANALSAGGRYEVAVLEAGPSDNRFWIKTPIGYGITYTDPSINWCYTAKADPALGGREEFWPRGKVVGGSSSINALVYHRGTSPRL